MQQKNGLKVIPSTTPRCASAPCRSSSSLPKRTTPPTCSRSSTHQVGCVRAVAERFSAHRHRFLRRNNRFERRPMLLRLCDAVSKCLYYAWWPWAYPDRFGHAAGGRALSAVRPALALAARNRELAMIWMVFIGASIAVRRTSTSTSISGWEDSVAGVLLFLKLVYYVFVGFVTLTFVFFGYGFVVRWPGSRRRKS